MTAAALIINKYLELLHSCNGDVKQLGRSVPLPVFSTDVMKQLCYESQQINQFQRPIIQLCPDSIIIVGDLHGNIHNMFTIFMKYGYPPITKYLFLGNVIDFGEFSLELITLLVAFQVHYPQHIHILRGFTEGNALHVYHGLCSDIESVYHCSVVHDELLNVFSKFPYGAFIYENIFCSQPFWIPMINDMILKEGNWTLKNVITKTEAFNHLLADFGKFDEAAVKTLKEQMKLAYVMLGSCPMDKILEMSENAILISSCNYNLGCVLPLCMGAENSIETFDSYDGLERKAASFKKAVSNKPIFDSKGMFIIPRVRSGPKMLKFNQYYAVNSLYTNKSTDLFK